MKRKLLSLYFLLFAAAIYTQPSGIRFALIIGNGNYSELTKLRNPANDASDMVDALKSLGFQAELLKDADLVEMEDAVVRLGSRLSSSPSSIGFFFYAGHGVQSNGINFLIPVDAHIPSESFLKQKPLLFRKYSTRFKAQKTASISWY